MFSRQISKAMKQLIFSILILAGACSLRAAEGGFLFVTFKGEQTPMTEQIYFGLSNDGQRWEALKGGEPVLVSNLGEKGARDPYLLRSNDGHKFYVLATDLSINRNHDWGRAVHAGSKSLIIWESNDLIHWSTPRLVKVAADDAGCTWAPEAIYDEATHDYLVYWASTNKRDNYARQRIWASRTRDFRTFSSPFIYIEKSQSVIDTDIIRDGNLYYRFSKDETYKAITMEVSDKLMEGWKEVPDFSLARLTGYEGPACFQLKQAAADNPATWCLLLDQYSRGTGYHPFLCTDLAGGQFTQTSDFAFPFLFRHGSVLPVTAAEYSALKAAYGKK